jgi:predicted tellurium resistance membrane protein TerC
MDLHSFFSWNTAAALVSLTAMEIVLGIDNIIFIAILVGRMPRAKQAFTRQFGLALALLTRIGLLFSISWVMGLTKPFFHAFNHAVSGRDAILFCGGLFLVAKSILEIHHKLEDASPADALPKASKKTPSMPLMLVQIAILDLVFSLDSVITAVGMTDNIPIMIIAMMLAMGVMMIFSGAVSAFVEKHATLKILALAFLILIGVMLVAESTGSHMDKGYIYFAMAFALAVEMVNLRVRKK